MTCFEKKILIIGAGFLQSFLIKRAKEMGFYTIAIDGNPHSVGFQYADEYKDLDIVDQDECLNFALRKNIDGVITAATDYGVLSASLIAKEMDLPGLDYEVAQIVKDKYAVRKIFIENKVDDIQQYYKVTNLSYLEEISSNIKFPVVVKPSDGSGSKGTTRVNSRTNLLDACEDAINSSMIHEALIEDFIEGVEYGVESFVQGNQIHVLGVMSKFMTAPPVYAELGHRFPVNLDVVDEIKYVVKKAINSLGINFGPVNMDVIVTSDNRICIIDVGARMGGNLIGSHIIPLGTGFDYLGNLLKASVGEPITIKLKDTKKNVVTRLLALKSGVVKELPDISEIRKQQNVDILHQLKSGTEIKEYKNNLDGCGYIVSTSSNLQLAKRNADEALRLIDKGIVRE